MKKIILLFLVLVSSLCHAQVKLEQKDFNNLISMSVHSIDAVYSPNKQIKVEGFDKTIESLRTPVLNHFADALIALWKEDKTILDKKFVTRPSNDELVLWYVLRNIKSNHGKDGKTTKPDSIVANETLSKKIDERLLLDNYYEQITDDLVMLFKNETFSLSNDDFNIESLGFKNETEKGIFFLDMMEGLIGPRFQLLIMLKKTDLILEHCNKLPTFNGKKYYYYKSFDYEDFDWIGNNDVAQSYNQKHIGSFYNTLNAHLNVTSEMDDKSQAKEIYFNSITFVPKYFKYSQSKDKLEMMYDKMK